MTGVPIPEQQSRAFDAALCRQLGIDPDIVGDNDFRADVEAEAGEDLAAVRVTFTAYLPAAEVLQMFNEAGRE